MVATLSRKRLALWRIFGWLVIGVATLGLPEAAAQFGRPISRTASFIEAPRSVSQYVREAERAIAEERYSDAVIRLGDLLQREAQTGEDEELRGQDYFVESGEDPTGRTAVRSASLLEEARRLLATLPESGLETYEIRYGPAARKSLAEAIAGHDLEGLRAVRRKYFHTEAGYQASWILAQEAMFRGNPLAASLLLDEVVATPRAVAALGDAVRLLHAAACQLAGRELPAVETLGGPPADSRVDWPAPDQVGQWAERRYRVSRQAARPRAADHRMLGGAADRNGGQSGEMPLSLEYWIQRATASPSQERTVREKTEELVARGTLPPPSWTPLRVGDYVLMRSTERLLGVDFSTGKLVWEYPWTSASPVHEEEELAFDMLTEEERPDNLLVQRIWNDLPYGQITSDGERVYMIDDLGEVEAATFGPWGQRGTRPGDGSRNTLVALELETEGKIVWSLGKQEEKPSVFADAFFLGPPLPLDGRLYVLVEIAGDISLVCLEPESGQEVWRQQLVAVESGGVEVDPIRRVAGAVPTYHEGVLICPTGAGAMVAFDLADRMLRWGVRFPRSSEFEHRAYNRTGSVDPMQLIQRWSHGAAIAHGTSVLVTPVESDRLFAFDLLSGAPRFPQINRLHFRYLAGIRDDRFFLVGADRMQAYDLQSGRPVWETPSNLVASGQRICGRGVFGDDSYFLPTTASQLIQVSLEDGSVISRRNVNYSLGNLVAVDGVIISQSATEVAVALGEATLEPRVEETLQEDPDNFQALVRRAQLLIQRGSRREALEVLERTRSMQPDNDEVRMLSVLAMLGILREDPAADKSLFTTLDRLIDQPGPRAELISLRVRAAIAEGDYVEAIVQLVQLSELVGKQARMPESLDEVIGDEARQCSVDSWIAARTAEIAASAEPDQLERLTSVLSARLEPLRGGSNALLRRLVNHFGVLSGTEEIREELFNRLRVNGDSLEMERLALGTFAPDQLPQLSDRRLEMLGEAYAVGELTEDAYRVVEALRERGAVEAAERISAFPNVGPRQSGLADWPTDVSLQWDSVRTMRTRSRITSGIRYIPTVRLAGDHFRGWSLVRESANPLAIRDPNGYVRPIAIESDSRQSNDLPRALLSGGMMVVVMPSEIVALDMNRLLDGDAAVVWDRSTSGDGGAIAKRRSVTNVFDDQVMLDVINSNVPSRVAAEFRVGPISGNRLLILQGGELICLDLLTSEQLWRHSGAPTNGVVLCDGEQVAVVSSGSNVISFFDLLDGEQLESRPWTEGEVWAGAGHHVLCYSLAEPPRGGTPRTYDIKLIDPFRGETRLMRRAAEANRRGDEVAAAYGRVLDGRYLVLLETSGIATIWDLVEAREVARVEDLPAYDDLNGVHAVALEGQILLLPKRRRLPSREPSATASLQTSNMPNHQRADAAIAVSLEDGKVRWQREFDQPWGCTLEQPTHSPIVVLSRGRSDFSSTGSRRREFEINAIDVRDGATLVERTKEVASSANLLETVLTVQAGQQRVRCRMGSEELIFLFGDQPEEPQPELEEMELRDIFQNR